MNESILSICSGVLKHTGPIWYFELDLRKGASPLHNTSCRVLCYCDFIHDILAAAPSE